MSPIFLMTLIICAVFACAFGLCEWLVRQGRTGRRVAARLEREGGSGAE
jgi:hypothetical protein